MKNKFHTEASYKRYLYAVTIAKQINEVIKSNKFMVIDDDKNVIDDVFTFESYCGEPNIMIGCISYISCEYEVDNGEEGKNIWFPTKSDIIRQFKKFKIMKSHKIKIKW